MATVFLIEISTPSMRNLLAIFLFFILKTLSLTGQSDDDISIIRYNDGSVFIGEIIDQDLLKLKMVLTTADTITLDKSKIKKIRLAQKHMILDRTISHRASGLFYNLDFSTNLGIGGQATFLSFTLGKHLNPKLSIGAGIAISHNRTTNRLPWIDNNMVHLFGHARYNFSEKKVRPFVEANLGWGVPMFNDRWNTYRGGLYANPAIGIEIATRRRISWTFKINQNIQYIEGEQEFSAEFFGNNGNSIIKYKTWLNRTSFSIGINF